MKKVLCYAMVAALLCGCGGQRGRHADDASRSEKGCAVYHWKTVFEMEHEEQNFLKKHDIRRIYLRMFDVAVEQDVQTGNTEIVPIATTRFESPIPVGVEVVPVTYITIGALRAMEGREQEFASLIMKRLMAMHSYNTCGELREVQLDCDWTATTRESYSTLCQVMKDSLHAKDIKLSVTVRLHQLQEPAPPADRGVLMLYNTGMLKDTATRNSILDINDAKIYLKKMRYPIPLDYAYPAFGWGVKFKGNEFESIVSEDSTTGAEGEHIRYERASGDEIIAVKELTEQCIGKPERGNILYHLDSKQLKHYTDEEIQQILAY